MISKKIILPVAALVIITGALAAAPYTYAQQPGTQHVNFFQGLIDAIAQKFGLSTDQVKSVLTDYQQQQKQNKERNWQQHQEDRLNQLVKDGKITDTQKKAILDELAVLKSKYNQDNFKNMTPDRKKQQFQAMQDEIKSWANTQGIDPSYVMPGFGMGMGWKGGGMRGHHGLWGDKEKE